MAPDFADRGVTSLEAPAFAEDRGVAERGIEDIYTWGDIRANSGFRKTSKSNRLRLAREQGNFQTNWLSSPFATAC